MFSPVVPSAADAAQPTPVALPRRPSAKRGSAGAAVEQPGLLPRMPSLRSFPRRNSSRRSVLPSGPAGASKGPAAFLTKREIPPHLAKLLLKTPAEQARVEAVKAILADTPTSRNDASLDLVYDWMVQNCKQYSNNIFGTAPEYIRREICRQMRLIKFPSQQLIIRQGDTGDRCYIVIDGLVDIYIKKEGVAATPSPMLLPTPAAAKRPGGRWGSVLHDPSVSSAAQLTKEYGNIVANLGPGAMFGEVVLMNPTARRNATILASQYTDSSELIFLERADYSRLVRGASMEASHYNQAEILDQMFLFQGWEKHDKMRLVSGMRSVTFSSNEYLYRAGTDAKWMYIISSGEVVERVNWSINRQNNSAGSVPGATASVGPSSTSKSASSSSGSAPEIKVNVDLMLIGSADVVGEWPFVKNKFAGTFDVRAVHDVHALALHRRVFETLIAHATPETNRAAVSTLQKLRRLCQERDDWRQQRLACGAAYPDAHVVISWPLMRMSNLSCPRCGQRGHLAGESGRCQHPSPRKQSTLMLPGTSAKRWPPALLNSSASRRSLSSAKRISRQIRRCENC
ncbi:hypothetical protein P43SY_003591 [Pythium insidiosum]|uniref:Cyclic nucleotide-binding domain-containing protein n=1 Tax=Pythium insidiosum TaxID=114742 RepID=A0AAD5LHD6_PYTIN|nr:hypothetical protein P43SY_003591 [Pythium insidiosum]